MGQDAGLRPGVVELVPCQDNGYRDSCGICNGDGSSCSAVATVTCFAPKHRPPEPPPADTRVLQAFVAVLTAMLLGVTIVWIRLWHTQTTVDDRV